MNDSNQPPAPSCPLPECDGVVCARAALGSTVATCVNQAGRPTRVGNPRGLDCVFCDRIAARDYDDIDRDVVSFAPLNPVTPGHRLFVPTEHVFDLMHKPWISAMAFGVAATYARAMNRPCNLITSAGAEATQTVMHLHVHYVPRRADDGLHLPWTAS